MACLRWQCLLTELFAILQVRQLLLVAMLVVARRGSVAQLFAALCISFGCFALQVHLTPYKHWEDNVLKMAIELQIFLTVTVALVLKCLQFQTEATDARVDADIDVYDFVLIFSFFLLVPATFVWAVCAKRSMMLNSIQEDLSQSSGVTTGDTASKRRAIRLLHLGLSSNDDLRELAEYFGRLDAMVNRWT